jgi:hypothetical protein
LDADIVIGQRSPMVARVHGGVIMMAAVQMHLIENQHDEIDLLEVNLKMLLGENKITNEEFAELYGYLYLTKQSLMKLDDLRFILANRLLKNQEYI